MRVCGPVIVFTTSPIVEFLESNLSHSYPLYNFAPPAGAGAVFRISVDGFLTFSPDSEVRITPEQGEYTGLEFDPTAYAIVYPADEAKVVNASYDSPDSDPKKALFFIQFSDNKSGVFLGPAMDANNLLGKPRSAVKALGFDLDHTH